MPTSHLERFSTVLWRQRDVLGALASRLGRDPATCEALLREVRVLELHRAAAGRAVAVELGVDDGCCLAALAAVAPGEWAAVLSGHHQALRALAAEALSVVTGRDEPLIQRSLRDFLALEL